MDGGKKSVHSTHIFIIAVLLLTLTLTTCDVFDVGLGEKVDIDPPNVAITSHFNGDYVHGTFFLSGSVSDDIGLESVSVTLGQSNREATINGTSWKYKIDTTKFPPGEHEITVQATDTDEKTVSTNILLIFDNHPPTVIMTSPQEYGAKQSFNTRVSIKGESADSTRVKSVSVSIFSAAGDVVEQGEAVGTTSWSYLFDSTTVSNGVYYVMVTAEDYAGNKNEYYYHFSDIRNNASTASDVPTIEQINQIDLFNATVDTTITRETLGAIRKNTADDKQVVIAINQDSDLPTFILSNPDQNARAEENVFGSQQRLIGLITDDDGVETDSIEIRITNTSKSEVGAWIPLGTNNVHGSGISVRWDYSLELEDGDYTVESRAEDIFGKQATSVPTSFIVNSQAPTVTVITPDQGTYISNNSRITLSGTAEGYGSRIVEVSLDGGNTWESVAGTGSNFSAWEFGIIGANHTDSTLTAANEAFLVKLRIEDGLGVYGYTNLQLIGDTEPPTLELLSPDISLPVNGTVTLNGVSTDNTVIDNVEINLREKDAGGDSWHEIDGTYSWDYEIDTYVYGNDIYAAETSPGSNEWEWTMPLRVTDAAGNRTEKSYTLTINQDSNKPTIRLSNLQRTGTADQNLLETNPEIIGTVEDDKKVDRNSIQIKINGGQWQSVSELPLTNQKIVNWSHDLSSLSNGIHELYIRAYDLEFTQYLVDTWVESYPAYPEEAYSNWGMIGPIEIAIDSASPEVAITSPEAGAYVNDTFQITGTAVDANAIEAVDISFTGGTSWTSVSTLSGPDASNIYTWSYTAPVGGSLLPTSGTYTYKVKVTDQFGKTSSQERQIIVDTGIPTVAIDTPQEGATLNGTVTVRGTAADNRSVSAVYFWCGETGVTPPTDLAEWILLDGTTSWLHTGDTVLFTDDATHSIHVKAVDIAGNTGTAATREVYIEQESDRPVISLSNLIIGGTYIENGLGRDPRIIGTIQDDDGVNKDTVEVSIDGGGWVSASDPPTSNSLIGSWSHDLSGLVQGEHTIGIRVRDVNFSGDIANPGTDNYNWQEIGPNSPTDPPVTAIDFMIDYGPPDLFITAPANASIHNSDVVIQGTSADANGVSSVQISIDGGASIDCTDTSPAGTDPFSTWSYAFTVDSSGGTDGVHTYQVIATDASGATTTLDRQFIVDATSPSVEYTLPEVNATVNGTSVEIRGTADDNRAVSSVYIWLGSQDEIPPTDVTGSWTQLSGTYTWSRTFDTTLYSDGPFVIHAKGEDSAGNISQDFTRAITIDQTTDRPVIGLTNISIGNTALENTIGGDKTITGTVEDDDGVAVTSIEINVNNAGWIPVSNPPLSDKKLVSWSHELTGVTEGIHSASFRARDTESDGGFETDDYNWNETATVDFILDFGPPSLEITSPANGSYKNSGFDIIGTSADANGIEKVEVYIYDDAPAWETVSTSNAYTDWTYAVPVGGTGGLADGTYQYEVRSTDISGTSTVRERQFTIDATIPSVEFILPADNSTVNDGVLLKGLASDQNSVTSVTLRELGGTEVARIDETTNTFSSGSTVYSWQKAIDTNLYTDGTTLVLEALAVDKAGNTSNPVAIHLNIDQSADEPQISLKNLSLNDNGSGFNVFTGTTIEGTIIDDDAVDITSIVLSVDGGATWVSPTSTSGSGASVDFSYSYAGLSEASYQLQVRVADSAAAKTVGSLAFPAITVTSTSTPFRVDWAAPTITVDSIQWGSSTVNSGIQGTYVNSDVTITGTATDGTENSTVEVRWYDSQTSSWSGYVGVIDTGAQSDLSTWEYLLATGGISDGSLPIQVRAIDVFGKTRNYDLELNVDTTAPTVGFSSPAAGAWVGGSSVTIQGNSGDGGVGVAEVLVTWVPRGTALDGTETWRTATGTTSWNLQVDSTAEVEGEYDFYAVSRDSVGNESSRVKREIGIDQNPPSIGEDGLGAGTTHTNSTVTLSGMVSDSYGVSTVEVLEDGSQVDLQTKSGVSTSWSYTRTVASDGSDDGSYTYTIIVTDLAGKTASVERTIVVDTQIPSATITSPDGTGFLSGSAYTIEGEASDVDSGSGASGLSTVYWWAGDTGTSPPADQTTWNSAIGTTSWNGSLNLTTIGEGSKTLHVVSADRAGNVSNAVTVGFMVDQAAPTVNENGVGSGTITTNAVKTLEGTAEDSNELSEVVIQENGVEVATIMVTGNSDSWSYETSTSDGTYTYTITAVDTAGRESTAITRTIVMDTEEPTVEFVSPATGVVQNGAITVKGTASDNNQIVELTLRASKTGEVLAEIDIPDTVNTFDTDSTVYSWEKSLDSEVYDDIIYAEDSNSDGVMECTVDVIATDKAGNSNPVVQRTILMDQTEDAPEVDLSNYVLENTATGNRGSNVYTFVGNTTIEGTVSDDDGVDTSSLRISIDGADPPVAIPADNISGSGQSVSFTYDISGVGEGNHTVVVEASDLLSAKGNSEIPGYTPSTVIVQTAEKPFTIDRSEPDLTQDSPASGAMSNNEFTVTGTASDDGSAVIDVSLKLNSGTYTQVSDDSGNGSWSSWSYELSSGMVEGDNSVRIRATDEFGKVNFANLTVVYDSVKPEVTISSPEAGTDISGEVTIQGTASDATTGVSEVRLLLVLRGTEFTGSETWTTATGTTNWNLQLDSTVEDEEEYDLYVKSVDAVGNESEAVKREIGIDQGPPTISEEELGEGTAYKNSDVLLGGTVGDSWGVASVEVLEEGSPVDFQTKSGESASWSYTKAVEADGSDDGTYTFTIVVTDLAGKTASVERTVVVDTVGPSAAITSPDGTGFISGSAYTVEGTATDDGAGVASVYWWAGDSAPPADHTTWNIASGTTSWNGSLNLTDLGEGNNTLHVISEDKTGKTSSEEQVTFMVDQGAPTIIETVVGSGTTLTNVTQTMEGDAEDNNGIHRVIIRENGSEVETVTMSEPYPTSYHWSYTTNASDGTYTYTITAVDIAGRESVEVTRTVIMDTQKPTVEYVAPASGVIQNGAITVKGTVSDNNQIVALELKAEKTGEVLAEIDIPGSVNTFDTDSTVYSWEKSLDSEVYDDAPYADDSNSDGVMEFTVDVVATDNAGNSSIIAQRIILIDQAEDSPEIELTNYVLDNTASLNRGSDVYVFVGNASIEGTVTDDDGVDTSSLTISIDGADPPVAIPAGNISGSGQSVSFTYDISGVSEGNAHTAVIAASDLASAKDNSEITGYNPSSVTTQTAEKPFTIDRDVPDLYIDARDPSDNISNTGFTITGTAGDDGSAVVDVSISINSGTYTMVDDDSGDGSWSIWSCDIVSADGLSEGENSLRIRATDEFGKKNFANLTVVYDTKKPSADISRPTGTEPVNGNITIAGTSADQDDNEVETVYLHITTGVDVPPALVTDWNYELTANVYNWEQPWDTSAIIGPADYFIHVKSVDAAGNVSDPDTVTVSVDQESDRPDIIITNLDVTKSYSENLLESNPRIIGTITDDDNVRADSVFISINAGAYEDVVFDPVPADGQSLNFSYDLSQLLEDGQGEIIEGQYSAVIRVEDEKFSGDYVGTNYNWEDTVAIEFTIDTGPPELTNITPANGEYRDGAFDISGTASDGNTITGVWVSFNGGVDWHEAVDDPGYPGNYPETWRYTETNPTQGEYTFLIKAVDEFDKTTTVERQIIVDTQAPTPGFSSHADGDSVNKEIVLTGTTSDNFIVNTVKLFVGDDGPVDLTADKFSWSRTINTENYDTEPHAVEDLPDNPGVWLLDVAVEATDKAGNTGTEVITLHIDQSGDIPTTTISTPSSGTILLPSSSAYGIAEDDDGLGAIYWTARHADQGAPPADHSTWITEDPDTVTAGVIDLPDDATSPTSYSWQATLPSGVGDYTLYVKPVDKYGVPATTNTTVSFTQKVTDIPTISITGPSAQNIYTDTVYVDVVANGGSVDEITHIYYTIDSDIVADPNEVTLSAGSGDFTQANEVNHTFSFNIDDYVSDSVHDVEISVRCTNEVPKDSSIVSLTIRGDDTPPEIAITSPSVNTKINGDAQTIQGTTSDWSQVKALYIGYFQNCPIGDYTAESDFEANMATDMGTIAEGMWFKLSSPATLWSHDLDTTVITSGEVDPFSLYVAAVDNVGIVNTTSRSFILNQNDDAPSITVTQPSYTGTSEPWTQTNRDLMEKFGSYFMISGTAQDDDGVQSVRLIVDRMSYNDTNHYWEETVIDTTDPTDPDVIGTVNWSCSIEGELPANVDGEYYRITPYVTPVAGGGVEKAGAPSYFFISNEVPEIEILWPSTQDPDGDTRYDTNDATVVLVSDSYGTVISNEKDDIYWDGVATEGDNHLYLEGHEKRFFGWENQVMNEDTDDDGIPDTPLVDYEDFDESTLGIFGGGSTDGPEEDHFRMMFKARDGNADGSLTKIDLSLDGGVSWATAFDGDPLMSTNTALYAKGSTDGDRYTTFYVDIDTTALSNDEIVKIRATDDNADPGYISVASLQITCDNTPPPANQCEFTNWGTSETQTNLSSTSGYIGGNAADPETGVRHTRLYIWDNESADPENPQYGDGLAGGITVTINSVDYTVDIPYSVDIDTETDIANADPEADYRIDMEMNTSQTWRIQNIYNEINPVDGRKLVGLEVTDNAGNKTYVFEELIFSEYPPRHENIEMQWNSMGSPITAPGETEGDRAYISGLLSMEGDVYDDKAGDPAPGISSVTIYIRNNNGTGEHAVWSTETGEISATIGTGQGPFGWTLNGQDTSAIEGAGDPGGNYRMEIEVKDLAGVTTIRNQYLYIDNNPPEATITAPEDGSSVAGDYNINGTVSDEGGFDTGAVTIEILVGGSPTGTSWTVTPQLNDTWSRIWDTDSPASFDGLRVTVTDKALNQYQQTLSISRDSNPPVYDTFSVDDTHGTASPITFTDFADIYSEIIGSSVYLLSGNVTFSTIITDADSAINTARIYVGGQDQSDGSEIAETNTLLDPSSDTTAPSPYSVGENGTYPFNSLANGEYTYRAWIEQSNGAIEINLNKYVIIDSQLPHIWIEDMEVTDYVEDGGFVYGHIESGDSINGTDDDVSGVITLDGHAFDNYLIDKIQMRASNMNFGSGEGDWVTILNRDSGNNYNWTTSDSGTALGELDYWNVTINGTPMLTHNEDRIDFTVTLNTALVADRAGLDKTIEFRVIDQAGNDTDTVGTTSGEQTTAPTYSSSSPNSDFQKNAAKQVDIVPYIVSIQRNPNTYNTKRSKMGDYAMRQGEAGVVISGFNFDDSANDYMGIDSSASSVADHTTTFWDSEFTISGTLSDLDNVDDPLVRDYLYTVSIPANAPSGWLRLTVNDVEAVNNLNANDSGYASEAIPNLPETDYWTDDRYVTVFAADTDAGAYFRDDGGDPQYPAMDRDSSGTLYASWSTYSTSDVSYSTLGSGGTLEDVFHGYDPPEFTDIAVNGTDINVLYLANYNGGSGWDASSATAGGIYAWDVNAPEIMCGRDPHDATYRFECMYHNQTLLQFKNIRVTRGANDRIYISYYDNASGSIKFSSINSGYTYARNQNFWGDYETEDEIGWINLDGGDDTDDTNFGIGLVTTYDGTLARATSTGEFSAITLDEQGYPLVVYYDAENQTMRLARSDNQNPSDPATNWAVQNVFPEDDPNEFYTGDHIAAEVDGNGILHIVAYKSSQGKIVYIRSDADYDDGQAYSFESSVTIDTSAGTQADLSVNLEGTEYIPYISYLDSTGINSFDGLKIAYYDVNADIDFDGVADGGWEHINVPLDQAIKNARTSIVTDDGSAVSWRTAIGYKSNTHYYVTYLIPEE